MTEQEELLKLKKKLYLTKFKLIADGVLIIVLLLLGSYVYSNIEIFKELNQDACAYCTEKTGAVCKIEWGVPRSAEPINYTIPHFIFNTSSAES